MSKYYERDFAGRWDAMGDEAEGVFEQVATTGVAPFGLNRPPISLRDVDAFIRYAPDRLQHNRLVEIMGIGRDGVLKLKIDKLDALLQWDRFHPVVLFIWDSAAKRHTTQPIREIRKQCESRGIMERFPEGKPAWFLKTTEMYHWEWVPHAAP